MKFQRLLVLVLLFAAACESVVTPIPKVLGTIVPVVNKTFTPSVPDFINQPEPMTFIDASKYEWREFVTGLTQPLELQNGGDGSNRLFVVERAGVIKIIQDGVILDQPFLDIRNIIGTLHNEQGLLGLAFHPNYASNRYFYVHYTDLQYDTVIARFQVSDVPNLANSESEKIILTVDQPFHNNNGGKIAFGPDGFLYIALGDGGDWSDPDDLSQNTSSLLGKILRIDVNSGDPYAIPADNPFGNEVWAYGLRNPWRFSFDPQTGDMFIGDVGQAGFEEVDFVRAGTPPGLNFGWDYREGFHRFNSVDELPQGYHFEEPIFEYDHQTGCAVMSGAVYRGPWAEWDGLYLVADYCLGKVWALKQNGAGWGIQLLYETGKNIVAISADETGDLYMVGHAGGVYHLTKK